MSGLSIADPLATAGDVEHLVGSEFAGQYMVGALDEIVREVVTGRVSETGLSDTVIAVVFASPTLAFREGGVMAPLLVLDSAARDAEAVVAFARELRESRYHDGVGALSAVKAFRDEMIGPDAVVAGSAVIRGVNALDASFGGWMEYGITISMMMTGGQHARLVIDPNEGINLIAATVDLTVEGATFKLDRQYHDTTPLDQRDPSLDMEVASLWALGRLNAALTQNSSLMGTV